MKIRTEYDLKPIGRRDSDWIAVDDETYDGPGSPIGTGATEQEAIDDLLEQIEEAAEMARLDEEARDGEEARYQAYRDRDIDGSW
jgi:hypothetical protein